MGNRREFSAKVKMTAFDRCCKYGIPYCELCGIVITGRPEYDHIKPDGLGGEPALENCQAICTKCHKLKTHGGDRPVMAKADRQKKSAAGVKRKHKWPKRRFGQ